MGYGRDPLCLSLMAFMTAAAWREKRGRGRAARCYRSVKAFRQLTGRAGDWIGQRGSAQRSLD